MRGFGGSPQESIHGTRVRVSSDNNSFNPIGILSSVCAALNKPNFKNFRLGGPRENHFFFFYLIVVISIIIFKLFISFPLSLPPYLPNPICFDLLHGSLPRPNFSFQKKKKDWKTEIS